MGSAVKIRLIQDKWSQKVKNKKARKGIVKKEPAAVKRSKKLQR
jgi:hypothetical protein